MWRVGEFERLDTGGAGRGVREGLEQKSSTSSAATTGASLSQPTGGVDVLWRHMTKIVKSGGRSGNAKIKCNFCNFEFTGSYTRLKAHLMRIKGQGVQICAKITPQIFCELQRELAEEEERRKPIDIPLPPSSQTQSCSSAWGGGANKLQMDRLKRKAIENNNPIQKAYNIDLRAQLDSEIARAFYSRGLPFHYARNPHYNKSYTMASEFNLSSYVPPTYNALRTTLLQKERANVERLLVPIRTTWKEKGVSIVSDRWSDTQRRPLINFMAVTENGPMFLKAVNFECEVKDKFHLATLMREVIMEVGPQNVVQVITDNAPVCKAAGMIIEASFPHIFWTPCVVHTLNLALKNICDAKNSESNREVYDECHWITEVASAAMLIKNFILNHNMVNIMFNLFSPLKLLCVAETRFASVIIMLRRFKLLKRALERLVLCEEWSTYREYDLPKAQVMRMTILDENWWDSVDYILEFTAPMYDMLRFSDTDKPSLHLVYDMWDDMIEKVKNIIYRHEKKELFEESHFYDVVYAILIARWTKSSSPIHCFAHSLNPRYYSYDWLNGAPNRLPPHQDIELSQERNKCIKRYFPDGEARKAVSIEYARFSGQMDIFGSADSIKDRGTMDPKMWWLVHGASAPNIQKIVLRLLGQPCSSSCCERHWSTYSFIHSVRRNKILPTRAEELVYVHTNLRLLSRKSDLYLKGETKLWDVGDDHFDPLDGVEELEIASLSLDEPEMEQMIYQDDDV
ncbi:uncharacterized protein LOC141701395 [Apium graveolens]|uniref:uncharacterized protein LOC141701395 n=1 Tax=Apium graveolens TaxID=4045 RepID=UPI003D7C0DFB